MAEDKTEAVKAALIVTCFGTPFLLASVFEHIAGKSPEYLMDFGILGFMFVGTYVAARLRQRNKTESDQSKNETHR